MFYPLSILDSNFDVQAVNGTHGLICYLCHYLTKGAHVGVQTAIREALTKLPKKMVVTYPIHHHSFAKAFGKDFTKEERLLCNNKNDITFNINDVHRLLVRLLFSNLINVMIW